MSQCSVKTVGSSEMWWANFDAGHAAAMGEYSSMRVMDALAIERRHLTRTATDPAYSAGYRVGAQERQRQERATASVCSV